MKKYVLPEVWVTHFDTEEVMSVTVSKELDMASAFDNSKMGGLTWDDFSNSN